jgi:hypothetical protein
LITSNQPNITTLGTLTNLTVSNNITSSSISSVGGTLGNLSVPGTITGGVFSGTLSAGTVNNITSLGNLSALTVSGNITSNSLSATSILTSGLNFTSYPQIKISSKYGNTITPVMFIGTNSLSATSELTNPSHNLAIGINGLSKPLSSSSYAGGNYNIAIGEWSMPQNTTGNYNIALGYGSLAANTTGNNNFAIGYVALGNAIGATDNIAFGNYAMQNNSGSVNNNIAIGKSALSTNNVQQITDNIAIGALALTGMLGGSQNIAIGSGANSTVKATYSNNIAIGYLSSAIGANTIAIGGGAKATGYYSVAFGQNATASYDKTFIIGASKNGTSSTYAMKVGIGTDKPLVDLDVNGTIQSTSLTVIGTMDVSDINASGTIAAQILDGTLSSSTQNSITSLGTLNGLTVSGNINTGSLSGTIIQGIQPSITTLAGLTAATITGNLKVTGNIIGGAFSGAVNISNGLTANVIVLTGPSPSQLTTINGIKGYPVALNDHTIVLTNTLTGYSGASGAIPIFLPAESSSIGRILIIANYSVNNGVKLFTPLGAALSYFSLSVGGSTNTVVPKQTSITLQCDGTTWYQIN